MIDFDNKAKIIAKVIPSSIDYWSARFAQTRKLNYHCQQNTLQPITEYNELGVFIYVKKGNAVSYGATTDLSEAGIKSTCERAFEWLDICTKYGLLNHGLTESNQIGKYKSPVQTETDQWSNTDYVDAVRGACEQLKIHEDIADWQSFIETVKDHRYFVSSAGAKIEQSFFYLYSGLSATAYRLQQSQTRTGGGWGYGRQGGLEVLEEFHYSEQTTQIAEQAIALTEAPPCPTGKMDLLLLANQMYLQIHESIGHPLELDRILGDERNYAGTSFVTPDMFGTYQYGSPLLNVSFQPSLQGELASYAFDDDGQAASDTDIIKNGILVAPLGSSDSQLRANLAGVANARSCAWNRPPIDRMANLNLHPGNQSLNQMIESIEYGVLLDTNRSWSIDDSRNKFQFGCELAYLIKDGKKAGLRRNPNYRGISANFWRNLKAVGDRSTFEILGTPHCGKGEPNQSIHVGHASPACLFSDVEVFGAS